MGRRRRVDIEGGVHHVMNRGVDRQRIFFNDSDRVEFGRRLAEIHRRHGVETLAYCLMGNHYHLLLRTPVGRLSEAMHHLGSVYTRHVNDRIGRDGPLFRSRFHSIHVTTDAYLLMATRYVHRNPLEIAGVRSIRDYRWSSYRAYTGERPTPSFVRTDLVTDLLGGDVGSLVEFHASVEAAPAESVRPSTAVELEQLVESMLALDDLAHDPDRPAAPRRKRTLLVLLLEHFGAARLGRQLDDALGFETATARRRAVSRARRRSQDDPSIARTLAALVSLLAAENPAV